MQNQQVEQNQTSSTVVVVIIAIVAFVSYWLLMSNKDVEPISPAVVPVIAPEIVQPLVDDFELEVQAEVVAEDALATQLPEPAETVTVEPEIVLPQLDESDAWLQEKLPNLTWRKELLKLLLTDDIIRRFVVFTDNFAQGTLAYEHSPLIKPQHGFSAIETQTEQGTRWQWDEKSASRFSFYVDLIRSMDSEMLVQWYVEIKPLVDQAYQELGYPDNDFTDVLQSAITKVLDMEIPKNAPVLERPSVMYRYQDPGLELLDDADKLLLRIGKENLLVIKSVLLEINEKIARVR